MDEETLIALKRSILLWRLKRDAPSPDNITLGSIGCPLCELILPREGELWDCKGCPVSAKTGVNSCGRTPYEHARNALSDWRDAWSEGWPDHDKWPRQWQAAAKAEINFLESLLPEGEQVEGKPDVA